MQIKVVFFFPELQVNKKTASRDVFSLHSSLFGRYKSWVKEWSFGNKSGCTKTIRRDTLTNVGVIHGFTDNQGFLRTF